MRLLPFSLLFLLGLSIVGCGGSSEPQTMDTSEIERYVNENPEAVAHQEELANAQEDADDEEDE